MNWLWWSTIVSDGYNSRYVNEVLSRDELPADATMGRKLIDIVNTAATHMQTEKLDSLVKNTLRVGV